ncbi:MAG: S-layer homology domain-containing protein [Bacillota bacterium]
MRNGKFIAVWLVLLLVLTLAGAAFAQPSDIAGHWAGKQIGDWISKGLASGYPDGTFKPDNTITRAEFVTLANKAFGFNQSVQTDFSDVKSADWFAAEVAKAGAAGYVSGYEDGTYGPAGGVEAVDGNVTIAVADVTLQNMIINGNLVIAEGVAEGNVHLKNVTVKGVTTINVFNGAWHLSAP